jgi:hypothetical protein
MEKRSFLRKPLFAVIILFWALMMGLLVKDELIEEKGASSYKPFLSRDRLLSDQWKGIYFNESLVGFVHTYVEPYTFEKGGSGYRILNSTRMNFMLLRKRSRVSFEAEAFVDQDYRLRDFNFTLSSGLHEMGVSGVVIDGGVMEVIIDSQGRTSRKKIDLPREDGVVVANIVSPFHSFGELKVGKRYNLKVFNPFSLALESLAIEVAGKEKTLYKGEEIEAFVVKSDYRGLEQTSWVSPEGEIVREETGMGWVLLKEDAGVVGRMRASMVGRDIELAKMVSLPANIPIRKSPDYIKTVLYGVGDDFDLESQRQKVIEKEGSKKIISVYRERIEAEDALTLPISEMEEFQIPSDFIQSGDDEIRALGARILGNEKNSFLAAQKINQWLFKNILKVPVVSIPSAIDVLKTKEGDCNEHTVLFAALARSAGIPTKVNVGLAHTDGRFYYHAWPVVYVGEWVDMDPTFGQDIADAAHIKLLEGDINRQLDIVRILSKIKLEVIEQR